MSEYQYGEFVAADRPFDERRRAQVRGLLSRARTPRRFVGEYERDDGWDDYGRLSSFAEDTVASAANDPRASYLTWLRAVQAGEIDDDEVEPPVPADFGKSSEGFARFSRIDEDLFTIAAASGGQEVVGEPPEVYPAHWIESLSAAARKAWSRRFVRPGLKPKRWRTAGDLLAGAGACRRAKKLLAERKCALREEAAVAREARLEVLAFRRDEAWLEVSRLIETKRPAGYDKAVELLCDLRVLELRRGEAGVFVRRFQVLRQEHAKKRTLMRRFERASLTAAG